MSRNKNPELSAKHLKALGLIEKGNMTLDAVSKAVGWKSNYIYHLYEGDTSHAGQVASLFAAEVRRIDKQQTKRIKELAKSNKGLAHKLIKRILSEMETRKNLSPDDKKLVATMMNCLAKATPNVEIGNVSYSYTKGYTPEQLIYEFRRFQNLTGGSSNRGAVQKALERGAGQLPDAPESGSETEEKL